MCRIPLLLLCLVLITADATTVRGGIFGRNRGDPSKRVPELITTLQSDRSEDRRASAADELQEYDPRRFPGIMSALIQALRQDTSSSVRLQAAQSLGRIRPISQQAGYALEQAVENDDSWGVRRAARVSLGLYYVVGYRGGEPKADQKPQTEEPPLVAPGGTPMAAPPMPKPEESDSRWRLFRRSGPTPSREPGRSPTGQTDEPPLAPPTDPGVPTPIPSSEPPRLPMAPTTVKPGEGPSLNPPK